jgi:uncharacterized protein
VFLVLGIGAGVLEALGPPPGPAVTAVMPVAPPTPRPAQTGPADIKAVGSVASPTRSTPRAPRPGRDVPGPIADPDPSLLEPYPAEPKLRLPRIAVDGRVSMSEYAAGFDPSSVRPRVGMLIAGIGMSEAESLAAIRTCPGA